jgi:hypothetical protein
MEGSVGAEIDELANYLDDVKLTVEDLPDELPAV